MDSGSDVYFTKDRCWIAKNNGKKELDMILSGVVFFVAAKPSKLLSRKRSALEFNSMSPAEVEQVTLTRVHAGFGVPGPAARDTLDGEEPSVRMRIPTGPVTHSAVERTLHKASGHALYRRWCRWCAAARAAGETHLREQQPETDEAVSRIEFDSAEFEREEDRTLSTSSRNCTCNCSQNTASSNEKQYTKRQKQMLPFRERRTKQRDPLKTLSINSLQQEIMKRTAENGRGATTESRPQHEPSNFRFALACGGEVVRNMSEFCRLNVRLHNEEAPGRGPPQTKPGNVRP